MLAPPSPNVHERFVMVPVDASVKVTFSDAAPLVGLAVKPATGAMAPVPVIAFVDVPPLLTKTTASVKLPALDGVKLTPTFVEPKPATLKGLPDAIANVAVLTVAVPVKVVPPRFVTTKLVWCVVPVAAVPKSKLPGATDNCVKETTEMILVTTLFALLVSTLRAETEATLVMLPVAVGVTTSVTDAVPLFVRIPRSQITRPNESVVQVP